MNNRPIRSLPVPLETTATVAQACAWIRSCVRFVGSGFHPDTLFKDYVCTDGLAAWGLNECSQLQEGLERAWTVLDRAGIDIYSAALPVQRRILKRASKS